MTDDLLPSALLGLFLTLLAFEVVAALLSWGDAREVRSPTGSGASWHGRADHGPLLLTQAFAIRDHVRERRSAVTALRSRYAELRTSRRGRQIRSAISQVRPGPLAGFARGCPSCRASRLRGAAHCPDCGRRLIAPAFPAGA